LSVIRGRVVGDGDPVWLEDDLIAALEYDDWLDSLCPGCGRPQDECMDPANDGRYTSTEARCFACEAREKAAARRGKQSDDQGGWYFGAREVEGGG